MPIVHAVMLLTGIALAGADEAGLAAAAAASGQPPECRALKPRAGPRGRTIWGLARAPQLVAFCDLMALAQRQLATDPRAAKASAQRADEVLERRAAPQVILARAALAMGDPALALEHFDRARAVDSRSVEHPPALRDLALALRALGKIHEARAAYRALAPRTDLLPEPAVRVQALLEAAHVSMTVESGHEHPGAPRLDEAIAFLREAEHRAASTGLEADVLLSLALVLDRSGDRAQADATLQRAERVGAASRRGPFPWVARAEDGMALEALALELADRAAAAKRWREYLASAGSAAPWKAAARARYESLASRNKAAAKPRPRGGKR